MDGWIGGGRKVDICKGADAFTRQTKEYIREWIPGMQCSHVYRSFFLYADVMTSLNKKSTGATAQRSSRRQSRRGRQQVDSSESPLAVGAGLVNGGIRSSYKAVLSSRPTTAAGRDVPMRDGDGRHISLLFSEDAWDPHALLDLPLESDTIGRQDVRGDGVGDGNRSREGDRTASGVPGLDVEDDAFFSTLFDDVLNDAEQFMAGVGESICVRGDEGYGADAVGVGAFGGGLDFESGFDGGIDGKTLEPFDVSHVLYVASPEVRDLVHRFPASDRQKLSVPDVVRLTNATMAQVRWICIRCCDVGMGACLAVITDDARLFHLLWFAIVADNE